MSLRWGTWGHWACSASGAIGAVGLAMLHLAFGEFYRRGKAQVTLDVDAESLTGATRLYEKAGMRLLRRQVAYDLVLREGKELATQMLGS